MSAVKRFTTGRIVVLAALCSALALAPAAQATQRHHHNPRQWSNYGSTKLVLDSGAVKALQTLGITPGLRRQCLPRPWSACLPDHQPVPQRLRHGDNQALRRYLAH